MHLFEISEAIERLIFDATDRETGELDDEALNELEALEGDMKDKAINCALYIQGELAEAKAVEEHAKALMERAKGHKRRAQKLKDRVQMFLLHDLGQEAISDPRIEIKWRKSKAVVVDEDADLPPNLTRVKVEPDKKAIGDLLKTGVSVEGCALEERVSMVIK